MIPLPDTLSPPEVGDAFSGTHLLHEQIDAFRLHLGDKELGREKRVTEQNVTRIKGFL